MIKDDLLNMNNNKWGYYDTLKRIIEDNFDSEDLNELVKSDVTTLNIISFFNKSTSSNFNNYYAIQNIETGELINRFYNSVFSYHPEQGYVLFQQDCERDLQIDMLDPIFRLVSLKTGKEFDEYLIDKKLTSGIRDLKFISYEYPSEFDYFEINPITEVLESSKTPIPTNQSGTWDLESPTGRSNLAYLYYNIEWIDFGLPYFETELFKSYAKYIPDFKQLNPL